MDQGALSRLTMDREVRMASPVAVRPAVVADVDAVARIWLDGWREAHLGNVPDALVAARTPESFLVRARELLDLTTVATPGSDPTEVAGFVMVEGDEVQQVYVDPRHRGTPVASALLAYAEGQIARSGHERAWLAVVAPNARARRFYERNGWRDDGPFDHAAPGTDGTPIPVPAHRYVKDLEDLEELEDPEA